MTEHWIWSNQEGAWRDRNGSGYTRHLRHAGRFHDDVVDQLLKANQLQEDTEYPELVAIPVTNTFLPVEAQKVLARFNETGDRKVIDEAYFAAQDRALVVSAELQESWGQMLRGEGRQI